MKFTVAVGMKNVGGEFETFEQAFKQLVDAIDEKLKGGEYPGKY